MRITVVYVNGTWQVNGANVLAVIRFLALVTSRFRTFDIWTDRLCRCLEYTIDWTEDKVTFESTMGVPDQVVIKIIPKHKLW